MGLIKPQVNPTDQRADKVQMGVADWFQPANQATDGHCNDGDRGQM